jgi:hypothetical protein
MKVIWKVADKYEPDESEVLRESGRFYITHKAGEVAIKFAS